MKNGIIIILILLTSLSCYAQNDTITNITVSQRTDGSGMVDVYFTLLAPDSLFDIGMEASFDAGASYNGIAPAYLSGDVDGISPGDNKHLVWDGLGTFPNTYSMQAKIKLIAFEEGSCPPTISDIDGNVYKTAKIGSQCWMAENLKTTLYNTGTPISYPGTNSTAWADDTTGAYAWYDNDISWKDSYGALYNWYATVNPDSLCPVGWHVPTNAQWQMLINALGNDEMAGGQMKSTRTEPDPHPRWNSPNTDATNASKWAGLPGGSRNENGGFTGPEFGLDGTFGAATDSPWDAHGYNLSHSNPYIFPNTDIGPAYGISVRCVWNESVQASLPTVTTDDITDITYNTATSGGIVTNDGGGISARGVVWSTLEDPTLESNDGFTTDGVGLGAFVSNLSNLSSLTLYFVKAYATSSEGTAYGQQFSFTTLNAPAIPTVNTTVITDITYCSAISGGDVTNAGDGDVTARGVVWSTSANPTLESNEGFTSDGVGLGVFSSFITGLSELTSYYVRAYATNLVGTAYGSQEQFTTNAFVCGTSNLPDIDGNVYSTVLVGSQCWMAENLKTTQYNNGIPISYPGTNNTVWANNTAGAYAWYNNDISWKDDYGALYNYFAYTNTSGLCPEGWHTPDTTDWGILINALGGESIAGGKMKSTRTDPDSHPRWNSPNTGATNESNWSGLPGGVRNSDGNFGWPFFGEDGLWWTKTDSGLDYPPNLSYTSEEIFFNSDAASSNTGLSVRCIKNE